ncbi:class I SAM-dependent RNA methyltransferase [Opitutus terrae]|uniref:class I SAM-dependent RNA methyltransferase n=1 Tax=Opitutus terrae TaxID=107709 RepID=UPI0005D0EE23
MCFVGKKKRAFNDQPFAYHQEIELEISTLTNLGSGLGRVPLTGSQLSTLGSQLTAQPVAGWVVMVPFTLPGERVRARVFRNHKNFSEADLVSVLTPSPHRVMPGCPLFGRCGGCQYQHLAYAEQLAWKRRQVAELLQHLGGVEFAVSPVIPSPREYGYRSKITPHFAAPKAARTIAAGSTPAAQESSVPAAVSTPDGPGEARASSAAVPDWPIGFLRQGTRFDIIDVPRCPIATDAINTRLAEVRAELRTQRDRYTRGATLLLRDAGGRVTTDYDAVVTEEIGVVGLDDAGAEKPGLTSPAPSNRAGAPLRLHFLARDFFQNNPFILPAFTSYVREQAAASGARFLVDAYCGSGLFALASASAFERVAGVEISESSVRFARENAAANGITNASFLAADAAAIFAGLAFPAAESVVVIDPPRKGCDREFLQQLFAFGPRAVVYVSCDPATQMRDLRDFLAAGYELIAVQPFDLFPQTRHLECVITLRRARG